MKLRFVLPALAVLFASLCTTPAKAQVGVYLNPVVTRVGISTADTGPFAFLGTGVTSRYFGGFDLGGYWDFLHFTGANAGLDIRETVVRANNADLDTFSVAARLASKHAYHRIVPYAQLAVGAGRSKAEENTLHTTRFEYGIFGGLDIPLNKHVDFRAIELGYGSVQTMSSSIERGSVCTATSTSTGTTTTTCISIPSATLFNMSTGLVFRFGR